MVRMAATHEVINQPPPLIDYDVFTADRMLTDGVDALRRRVGDPKLQELGPWPGAPEAQRWADEANRYPPILRTHDRYGHRIDEVEYHPSYHELMRTAIGHGLHAAPWADERPGAHVVRAAGFYRLVADRRRPWLPDLHDVRGGPRPAAPGVDPAIWPRRGCRG